MTDDDMIAFVRECFFEPARLTRQHSMTEEQTGFMVKMTFAPDDLLEDTWAQALEDGLKEARIIDQIMRRFTRPTAPGVRFFLSQICQTPADAVMYLAFAHAEVRDRREPALTMDNLCEIFALGFWTESDRQRLWDSQKMPYEAWKEVPLRPENALDDRTVLSWVNAEIGVAPAPAMTRREHLAWCKERALAELDAPGGTEGADVVAAFASRASDLQKHPKTAGHLGITLGMQLLIGGHLKTRAEMRRHIERYN